MRVHIREVGMELTKPIQRNTGTEHYEFLVEIFSSDSMVTTCTCICIYTMYVVAIGGIRWRERPHTLTATMMTMMMMKTKCAWMDKLIPATVLARA